MQPRIAYLIDDNYGWDDDEDWKFYDEKDVPGHKLSYPTRSVKRIVYWEI